MSRSLSPKKLVERLSVKIPTGPEETRALLEEFFDIISEEIKKTGRLSLFGFGSFSTNPVKGSIRKNPRPGDPIIIPDHLRIKFSPAAALSLRINREYADLEPVIIEEIHEGLYMKASRYRDDFETIAPNGLPSPEIPEPEEFPPVSIPETMGLQNPPPVQFRKQFMSDGVKRVVAALIIEGILLTVGLLAL